MTLTAAELALQFDPYTRALWHLERRVRQPVNEGTTMANHGKHGNLRATSDWWDSPLKKWMRGLFWKRERQAQRAALPARLEDDYTHEEFMADICEPGSPCDLCKAKAARSKTPNVL